jgi:hypothetical protein
MDCALLSFTDTASKFCIVAVFVQTVEDFHTKHTYICRYAMSHLRKKKLHHMAGSVGSLVFNIKPRAKYNSCGSPCYYFIFYKNRGLNKSLVFFIVINHTQFRDRNLSCVSIASTLTSSHSRHVGVVDNKKFKYASAV